MVSTPAFSIFRLAFLLVLPLGSHAAPDMPLLLVFIQNGPDLGIQNGIALGQSLGQGFVDGGFGNAELPGSRADSGTGFNHVHSQLTGALL